VQEVGSSIQPQVRSGASVIDWHAALSKLALAVGAIRAINRLAIGVAGIGIAWSESLSNAIREDSNA
jgi:hypothetical protein